MAFIVLTVTNPTPLTKSERMRAGINARYFDTRDRAERRRLARLADVDVARDAEEDESLLDREAPLVDEQPCSVVACRLHRLHEVATRGAVCNPSVGELGHRPPRLAALDEVEPDCDLTGDLDACAADLAVTHGGVHVADREHPARLPNREMDARSRPVEVVVEVSAVLAGVRVRQLLAPRCDADHADHRTGREADPVRHHDLVPFDPKNVRERRLNLADQLPEAGDDRRDALVDGLDREELRHERVAGLRAFDPNRAGGAVHARHVDRRHEVVLARDLAREAVVRLERDDVARLDLEHRLEVGAKSPNDLVPGDSLPGRGSHQQNDRSASAAAAQPLLLNRLELVADAVARLDERVPRRDAVDLVPQAPDEDVDRPVAMSFPAAPDPLQELVAGRHPTPVEGQRIEEPED